jgi:nucleotide-binding universal stress UspA family protein
VEYRVTPAVLIAPATVEALINWARSSHVDPIVMGTHGRGQAPADTIGSVADTVVRTAPCPVLVVRRPQLDSRVTDSALQELETGRVQ